ncbi:hypothetical protein EBR16_00530 [bacterium]|nr:hypothetical protein [bacterium]
MKREGTTILLVEQNVERALSISDRAYIMDQGVIVHHDTAANLLATGDCVIHLCDEPLAARMVACARALPPGESEIERGGFATRPAERVRAPLLAECPVALECRFLDHRRYGENRLFVVEILLAHVRAGVADPATWKVDYAAYAPIGRMHSPDGYARTTDRFRLPFPRD